MLAGFLLYQKSLPDWSRQWVRLHLSDTLSQGQWRCVPIIVTNRREAYLRFLIAGLVPSPKPLPLCPVWTDAVFDTTARQSLDHAAHAAITMHPMPEGHSLHVFPLLPPDGRTIVRDGSLGLPAAIGFLSLLTGEAPHPMIAATGKITSSGNVGKISGIDQKVHEARNHFSALICPDSNTSLSGDAASFLMPVSHLREAWMFHHLYAPEAAENLVLFSDMLKKADRFVCNSLTVPADWIKWAANQPPTRQLMDHIFQQRPLFEELLHHFKQALNTSQTDKASAIADLVSFEDMKGLSSKYPLLTFQWCSAGLCLCNHLGKMSESSSWIAVAESLVPIMREADGEAVANYYNHYLVARHNQYRFTPEIPAKLSSVLSGLERQHAARRQDGCRTFPVLGRIYGTLAQNYAFCGPDFLAQTETCNAKARRALGENTVFEHQPEWLRQYNYLAYALLDAQKPARLRLRKAVFACLNMTRWGQMKDKMPLWSEWDIALMVRFLADSAPGRYHEIFFEIAAVLYPAPPCSHPWQLWCFNMGRLAHALGRIENARHWFVKSLEICRSEHLGPTVQVMGLLGLSGLYQSTRKMVPEYAEIYNGIKDAALALNSDHFHTLKKEPPASVLTRLWENPSLLFPFNYH